jgi:hypothetical protein
MRVAERQLRTGSPSARRSVRLHIVRSAHELEVVSQYVAALDSRYGDGVVSLLTNGACFGTRPVSRLFASEWGVR